MTFGPLLGNSPHFSNLYVYSDIDFLCHTTQMIKVANVNGEWPYLQHKVECKSRSLSQLHPRNMAASRSPMCCLVMCGYVAGKATCNLLYLKWVNTNVCILQYTACMLLIASSLGFLNLLSCVPHRIAEMGQDWEQGYCIWWSLISEIFTSNRCIMPQKR